LDGVIELSVTSVRYVDEKQALDLLSQLSDQKLVKSGGSYSIVKGRHPDLGLVYITQSVAGANTVAPAVD